MRNNRDEKNYGQTILLGVLAGTVIGAVTAAFMGSTTARELKENLFDAYDYASKKVTDAAHSFNDSTHDFTDRFMHKNNHSNNNLNATIGAIAVGILGISALVFLTSDSAKGIRSKAAHAFNKMTHKAHNLEKVAHSAYDNIEENITPWINKVEKILDALNERKYSSQRKNSRNSQPLDTFFDWASTAVNLYQSLKK